MKPALIGVAALVLGLAGGTGVTVMKHKKLAAQVVEIEKELEKHDGKEGGKHGEEASHGEAEAHGDSTASHADGTAAHGDSAKASHDAAGDHAAMPAAALTAAPATPPAHDAGDGHGAKPADAVKAELPSAKLAGKGEVRPASASSAMTDAAARTQGFKQLGRIFASMKAEDAAKVMALMTDDEVEGVLRSLSPKEAANMIGQLPKERAAALSRRLLVATIK
jgi:folylpolyglutamate synthase/dihydropteroate synthase